MKKLGLLILAAFFIGGMAMAQSPRRGNKTPDPKVRAERMTERMAKEYSLNDDQKKQLLEANITMMENMRDTQKEEKKAERAKKNEKRAEKMKTSRTAYHTDLQKIMTKEQYASYTQNMQNRQSKKGQGRREVQKM